MIINAGGRGGHHSRHAVIVRPTPLPQRPHSTVDRKTYSLGLIVMVMAGLVLAWLSPYKTEVDPIFIALPIILFSWAQFVFLNEVI